MAVNYVLRDPNLAIANTPEEREADQALVTPRVVLKANPGRGAQLVDQITAFASLLVPNEERFDQLCEGWEVTEDRHKKALKILFNILRLERRSLKLDDPSDPFANVTRDVNPPTNPPSSMAGKK